MRILGLDILRIVAVGLVFGRHMRLPSKSNCILAAWFRGGWVGVDLFFVLSGFLISSLLFKEQLRNGTINITRFLIRRGFKIYPAFWCFLSTSLLVSYFNTGDGLARSAIFGELCFLQNYCGGVWNHTWSLAVEEHFYIGLALVFFTLDKVRPNHRFEFIPVFCFWVAAFCFLARCTNLYLFPEYSPRTYLFGTHIRIDSLFFGVFVSYLCHFHRLQARTSFIPSAVLVALGGLLIAPAFIFAVETNKWVSIFGVVLFYSGSGALLLAAIRLQSSSSQVLMTLGSLGGASYSIYLWHMPVNRWLCPLVPAVFGVDSWILYMCTYVLGACVVGCCMNRLIEKPSLAIRDRLFPSRESKSSAEQCEMPEVLTYVASDA